MNIKNFRDQDVIERYNKIMNKRRINSIRDIRRLNAEDEDSVVVYLDSQLADSDIELVMMLYFDHNFNIISSDVVGVGDEDSAPIHYRKILKLGLMYDARYAIMAHNHPSGVALPSSDDLRISRVMKERLHAGEIELLDHIIIGDGEYYSMYDNNEI